MPMPVRTDDDTMDELLAKRDRARRFALAKIKASALAAERAKAATEAALKFCEEWEFSDAADLAWALGKLDEACDTIRLSL